MKRFPHLAALALLSLTLATPAAANWPQYRGVRASGLDSTHPLPTQWNVSTGEHVRWQTPIPGLAHASPIIWGDRIYVATAISPGQSELKVGLYGDVASAKDRGPTQWRLLALERNTGAVAWDVLAHEGVPKVSRHPKATHCNSTPATDGRRIVAIFGSEGLFCFDRDGKLLWKKDLGPMVSGFFSMPSAQWGFASSPVIHEGRVIVQCDVLQDSFIAAFDLEDGREVWRTARKDVPTWSTPTIFTAAGRTQIAVNGWHHAGGYDFATGRELWRHDGGGDIPVPTPIVGHGLIFLTSAHGRSRPMRAVRVDAAGDISPAESGALHPAIAWERQKAGNYMQTPILVGELLFACADTGLVTCYAATTGEIHYTERLSKRPQGFTASPVSDGRHVYFTSEIGHVFVVPAQPGFAIAAENELGETSLATPAIADGTLYFRTRDQIVAIGRR